MFAGHFKALPEVREASRQDCGSQTCLLHLLLPPKKANKAFRQKPVCLSSTTRWLCGVSFQKLHGLLDKFVFGTQHASPPVPTP